MELLGLDRNFQPVKTYDFINLQWNRKYYECGTFSVQIIAEDYDDSIIYLFRKDRPETGIIQKIEYSETIKGAFVQLTGFFLECLMNDKIIYPTFFASGNIETECNRMVSTYKDDIPFFEFGAIKGLGKKAEFQETGGQMGSVLYRTLQTQELSYRLKLDYVNTKLIFEIYQGLDRTQDQDNNNPVVFSKAFKNISKTVVTTDNSNYKNYIIVAGQGEGSARMFATVDKSNGAYRRQVFYDQRNEAQEGTDNEYLSSLRQIGEEALLSYQAVQNIELEPQESAFRYLKDFDLGDKVDNVFDPLKLSFQSRIIEINEVYKNGNRTISLTIGDKILTQYEKARIK